MNAFDETVALSDPEHCPFESDFLGGVDDASFEAHLGDILHEKVAKLINSILGVGEEAAPEFDLPALNDG